MSTTSSTRVGVALACTTALVSGVAIYLNGFGVRSVGNATTYTTAKNLVAAVVLVAVAGWMRARHRAAPGSSPSTTGSTAGSTAGSAVGSEATPAEPRPRRGARIAVAVVGGSVPFVLFFEGLARADSVDAAFIHKTLVVWVAILALPFLRERPGPRHLLAIGLLLAGHLAMGGMPALAMGTGEVMIAVATLLWAIEFVVAKRALADVSSHDLAAWRMAGGSVLLVGWLLVTGGVGSLLAIGPTGWAWVLGTGVVLSAYVGTWYAAMARIPAVDVAAILVAGAIVTALLQAGFDGAALVPSLVGLGLLGAGAAVAALPWARAAWPQRAPVGSST